MLGGALSPKPPPKVREGLCTPYLPYGAHAFGAPNAFGLHPPSELVMGIPS